MKIAIVDDEDNWINQIKDGIQSHEHFIDMEIETFCSGEKILEKNLLEYKIIFLDIEMPAINGMDLAAKIYACNPKIIIFYVTSYISLVTKALNNYAFTFIPKPIIVADLHIELSRALKRIADTQKMFRIKWRQSEYFIAICDIVFLESYNKKCVIHTSDNKEHYAMVPLNMIEEQLDLHHFARVHKSYIININYIKKMTSDHIMLEHSDSVISVSRKYKTNFLDKFNIFLHEVVL